MASHLTRIKAFFAPPIFPDDEDKTRMAGVLNVLLLAMMLFLVFSGGILVPFVYVAKLYNVLFILTLLLMFALAYWLMRRGRVRLASAMLVSTLWIIFTIFLSLAGGMTSIVAVFYVAGTVIAGLLLGTRAALIHAAACILAGLGMVILEASGHSPPRLFPVPPLVGWMDLATGLMLAVVVLSLVLRSLKETLALARQEVEERKKAEESLRRRERDFSTLAENATDMIVRFDTNLRHVYCNPAVERQLGIPVQTLLGKAPLELEGPREQAEFIDRSLRKILETEKEQQVEQSYPTPFGLKHFQTRIVPERDPNGRIESLLAITRDITNRKRAEDALRESEERYRTLVENSLTGVGISQGNQVIFANPALLRIFGYDDLEEFAQVPLLDHVAPSSQAVIAERMKKVAGGESAPAEFEYDIVCKNGQIKTLQAATSAMTLRGERYTQTTFQDVTERKQAEEERVQLLAQVQEQAQRIQQIMDTVPEGVLLLDPDGHIIVANPLAEEHLLTLVEAEVGDILTHLGERPLNELLTSPPKGLWHEVATDGQSFQVIARPLEAGPQSSGWVLVIHDVTQQREAERYLQQQERLAALGQLAAGMAHDFNNIMAVVTLYAGMSLRTPDLPDKVRERLQTIDEQAHRASRLIQQILDFSRRAILERGPLDLTTFLKEQVNLLQRTLPEHIQIDLTYGRDEYIVHADPTRIQQAVMNLATNARDAMPEGGRLHFGLERVAFGEGDTPPLPEMKAAGPAVGQWIRLTVTDTGTGIPPEIQPHVFDPFFTTKEPGKGTGLGLAQVYGIVKQHEGHIDFTTEAGRGTTFTLYLPALVLDKPEEPHARAESLPQGEEQTILVVEDEAATRQAIVEGLETLGYRVLEATNGREALATFEQHAGPIALVLSDLVMPAMGGQALFHALRQQDPTIKVLVMSGHPLDGQELESLRAQGLGGWLPKPPSLEQLAQTVARVLEEGQCF